MKVGHRVGGEDVLAVESPDGLPMAGGYHCEISGWEMGTQNYEALAGFEACVSAPVAAAAAAAVDDDDGGSSLLRLPPPQVNGYFASTVGRDLDEAFDNIAAQEAAIRCQSAARLEKNGAAHHSQAC